MTRRTSTSTSTRPIRQRHAAAPPRRAAGGQAFTRLGFAFFRLVPSFDREPGESPYTVLRLREARTTMAAFAAMS